MIVANFQVGDIVKVINTDGCLFYKNQLVQITEIIQCRVTQEPFYNCVPLADCKPYLQILNQDEIKLFVPAGSSKIR